MYMQISLAMFILLERTYYTNLFPDLFSACFLDANVPECQWHSHSRDYVEHYLLILNRHPECNFKKPAYTDGNTYYIIPSLAQFFSKILYGTQYIYHRINSLFKYSGISGTDPIIYPNQARLIRSTDTLFNSFARLNSIYLVHSIFLDFLHRNRKNKQKGDPLWQKKSN